MEIKKRHNLPVLSETTDKSALAPPCLVCRRRFRPGGRQVFTNCTCLQYGPRYTVLFCGLGVAAVAGLAYVAKRARR